MQSSEREQNLTSTEFDELEPLESLGPLGLLTDDASAALAAPSTEAVPAALLHGQARRNVRTSVRRRPASASLDTGPLPEQPVRSLSLPEELTEAQGPGSLGADRARERNKKAQRTFRQRQKAKVQQQEEELAAAASRVSDLEDHLALLQRLHPADTATTELGATPEGESSTVARMRAMSSALQLETSLQIVREFQLLALLEQHQARQSQLSSASTTPSPAQVLGPSNPFSARIEITIARCNHLKSMKPCAAWNARTPVPMEQLYSSILQGRLDLRLPLANEQVPDRAVLLSRLMAMPTQDQLQLQAQYYGCLASSAAFCGGGAHSLHGQHLQAVMGEAMALLAVFMECLPQEFLACQGISMLDGTTRMPQDAFEKLKSAARNVMLEPNQVAAAQTLHDGYSQQAAAADAERQAYLLPLQAEAATPAALVPELTQPHQAAASSTSMGRVSVACVLQQEAYLHLIRSFVLHILTPFQAGLLCAAAFPYLIEFPCVLVHILARYQKAQPSPMESTSPFQCI